MARFTQLSTKNGSFAIGPDPTSIVTVSMHNRARQYPLYEQSLWFIKNDLGLPSDKIARKALAFVDVDLRLSGLSSAKKLRGDGGKMRILDDFLSEYVPTDKVEQMRDLMVAMRDEALADGREEATRRKDNLAHQDNTPAHDGQTQDESPSKKQRTHIEEDLGGIRDQITTEKSKKSLASRKVLWELLCTMTTYNEKKLCEKDRQYKKRMMKVWQGFQSCIDKCHNSDPESFFIGPHTGSFKQNGQCTCKK